MRKWPAGVVIRVNDCARLCSRTHYKTRCHFVSSDNSADIKKKFNVSAALDQTMNRITSPCSLITINLPDSKVVFCWLVFSSSISSSNGESGKHLSEDSYYLLILTHSAWIKMSHGRTSRDISVTPNILWCYFYF